MAWPTPNALFGLGTHAVLAAMRSLGDPMPRLHVPDYFCQEVVDTWIRHEVRVVRYEDDPRWTEPDWGSIRAAPGDAVMAVNYFGVRTGRAWQHWQASRPDLVSIEDHSHDPLSDWARGSTADVAFASLRKTLPISDGAILWSPSGRSLPAPPPFDPDNGSRTKQQSMERKRDYLTGRHRSKSTFRSLQLEGEKALLASAPSAISPWSGVALAGGLPVEWRRRRRRNVRMLLDATAGAPRVRPLFSTWQADQCPFNLVLEFESQVDRDRCRSNLIRQNVYPPVHWAQRIDAAGRVRDLADRILTVPADQRYDATDMLAVAATLRDILG